MTNTVLSSHIVRGYRFGSFLMKSSACARWKAAVDATFGQKTVISFYTAVAQ